MNDQVPYSSSIVYNFLAITVRMSTRFAHLGSLMTVCFEGFEAVHGSDGVDEIVDSVLSRVRSVVSNVPRSFVVL
jgi:hypothetical protein